MSSRDSPLHTTFVDLLNIEGGHDTRLLLITLVMKQLAFKIPSSSTSFLSLLLNNKFVMDCNSPKCINPLFLGFAQGPETNYI